MLRLVFDTETTGLLPKFKKLGNDTLHLFPYIVQMSWIIYDDVTNEVIKKSDFIVKLPENVKISEECTKINGITNEMSQEKGVNITDVIDEFIKDFDTVKAVIAHNLEFDLKLVKTELMRLLKNENYDSNKTNYLKKFMDDLSKSSKLFCTMQESIDLCNIKAVDKYGREYVKFPKLSELHNHLFQNTPKNLHNSFNDVIVCLRCYYKLFHDKDILEINKELNDLYLKLLN